MAKEVSSILDDEYISSGIEERSALKLAAIRTRKLDVYKHFLSLDVAIKGEQNGS